MTTAWLDTFLDGHRAELIAFRRHLHAHPELSYAERDTTDLIAQRLQVAGSASLGSCRTSAGSSVTSGPATGP